MLGSFLKARRKAARLSQTDLAKRTGVPQTYLSRIERGEVALPQRATRDKLGAVLGITERDWLDAAGEFAVEDDGEAPAPPTPIGVVPRDSDNMTVAQMVAKVEGWGGPLFQQQLADNKARLSVEAYEKWCVNMYRMWEGNSLMVFSLMEGEN